MSRTSLIFLDTETTGLQPDKHTPWEIAWVTAVHDTVRGTLGEVTRCRSFVSLCSAETAGADPIALRVGGFHERYEPDQAAVPTDIVNNLQAHILAARLVAADHAQDDPDPRDLPAIHLVGAIPSFDHAMICQNWTGWPGFGEGLWHYHLIDVEALTVGAIVGSYLDDNPTWPVNSEMLDVALFGETWGDQSQRHTAMHDALHALAMYAHVYSLEHTVEK